MNSNPCTASALWLSSPTRFVTCCCCCCCCFCHCQCRQLLLTHSRYTHALKPFRRTGTSPAALLHSLHSILLHNIIFWRCHHNCYCCCNHYCYCWLYSVNVTVLLQIIHAVNYSIWLTWDRCYSYYWDYAVAAAAADDSYTGLFEVRSRCTSHYSSCLYLSHLVIYLIKLTCNCCNRCCNRCCCYCNFHHNAADAYYFNCSATSILLPQLLLLIIYYRYCGSFMPCTGLTGQGPFPTLPPFPMKDYLGHFLVALICHSIYAPDS